MMFAFRRSNVPLVIRRYTTKIHGLVMKPATETRPDFQAMRIEFKSRFKKTLARLAE